MKDILIKKYGPKYRFCKDPATDAKVIFFCDWDYLTSPKGMFFGKPIYFGSFNENRIADNFEDKNINGNIYKNFSKLKPEMIYLDDISLITFCQLFAPNIATYNLSSLFYNFIPVKTEYVFNEVFVDLDFNNVKNDKYYSVIKIMSSIIRKKCTLGLIGSNILCSEIQNDIDLVIIADTLNELQWARERINKVSGQINNKYLNILWPLTTISNDIPLDFFFNLVKFDFSYKDILVAGEITSRKYYFEEIIISDDGGILSIPYYTTDRGNVLLSFDNALRGRIQKNDRVSGIASKVQLNGQEFIIIQSEKNISIERKAII
jgi:hypothetical protein